jgi:hypothetical protein
MVVVKIIARGMRCIGKAEKIQDVKDETLTALNIIKEGLK